MMQAAADIVSFSPLVLLTLLLMFGASVATLVQVIRRSTSKRFWVAMAEWGRENRFRIEPRTSLMPPPPFSNLTATQPKAEFGIARGTTMLLQLRTGVLHSRDGRPEPIRNAGRLQPGSIVWHVLVRRIGDEWPACGLRPAEAARSALDLFDLPPHPTLGNARRFMAYGVDALVARQLAESFARSLLPPDIGLLLHGHRLVLDFSARPFDTIELNRVIALADQVADKLPAPYGSCAAPSRTGPELA